MICGFLKPALNSLLRAIGIEAVNAMRVSVRDTANIFQTIRRDPMRFLGFLFNFSVR